MKLNELGIITLILLMFIAIGAIGAVDVSDDSIAISDDSSHEAIAVEDSSDVDTSSDDNALASANSEESADVVTSENMDTSGDVAKAITYKECVILAPNMTTTLITSAEGRVGEYFVVKLTDTDGNPLVGKNISIGFNGAEYKRTTNATGQAQLQINLKVAGGYTFAVAFLNDNEYSGQMVVAKITVVKKTTTLTVPAKTFKSTATTKKLTATLKDNKKKVVSGQTIKFTINGKTYSAKTNASGIVTVKISITTKKTYTVTVKYSGTSQYKASSKTAKVVIK